MKPIRRKYTRALVTPHNMEPPRSDAQKRADIPLAGGDITMSSAQAINDTYKGDGPGQLRISEIILHKTGDTDERGQIIYVHEAVYEWVKDKVCDGCHLTLGVHFIQTYSGAHAVIDAILGDGSNYRHYHPDCEPTDGEYKFKVEYGAIKRTVVGTPGKPPVSKMR